MCQKMECNILYCIEFRVRDFEFLQTFKHSVDINCQILEFADSKLDFSDSILND
jgi:hypothetical protein